MSWKKAAPILCTVLVALGLAVVFADAGIPEGSAVPPGAKQKAEQVVASDDAQAAANSEAAITSQYDEGSPVKDVEAWENRINQADSDYEPIAQRVEGLPTNSETNQARVELGELNVKHAYDPMAEIEAKEAEQAYRESCDIAEGKVLFTVREWRAEGADASHLDDGSELAQEYGLRDVKPVLETKSETAGERDGMRAYDVYYQAATDREDIWGLADEIQGRDDVVGAEPEFVWETAEVAQATAAEMDTTSSWSESLRITDVWHGVTNGFTSQAPGAGTVVAVIDTGVDYTHPDLAGNIWVNSGEVPGNGIDDDGNGYVDDIHGIDLIEMDGDPMDDNGHGTHVAGIIAMEANGFGGVGVAYGASVMCIKAGQANGLLSTVDIAKAIEYASANGADVVNMSFAGSGRSSLVEAALADAFGTTVLVAAAGNNGRPTTDAKEYAPDVIDMYPAGYTYVIGVMATDNNGVFAGFSNFDYIEGRHCEYEIAAPGVNIFSTLPNGKYAAWSGTSMAAPMVAASAAVLRSKHADKSVYTSRYIAGQLVGASNWIVPYYGKRGDYHEYPYLSLSDSLANQPRPKLLYEEFYTLDSPEISSANNGDGIVQAGETIDFGFVMKNRWGTATDVKVTASAVSGGGVPNPYVTFISSEATLPDIGTFMTANNGFLFEDDNLVSISNPIRIKISDDAPNDALVEISFEWSAKNGMDSHDDEIYRSDSAAGYSLIVQKGQLLRGVITEDTTLTADKYWIVDSLVTVAEGVTVNVDPGTQIQFWSSDSASWLYSDYLAAINVIGRLNFNGTQENPIELFPSKIYENYGVEIGFKNGSQFVSQIAKPANGINMSYVKVVNPRIHADAIDHLYAIQNTDHVWSRLYRGSTLESEYDTHAFVACNSIEKSNLEYVGPSRAYNGFENYGQPAWYSALAADRIVECSVSNSCLTITDANGGFENPFSGVLTNSVLRNISEYGADAYGIPFQTSQIKFSGSPVFSRNAIINPRNYRHWLKLTSDNSLSIAGNYWGTTNADLIRRYIVDSNNNPSLSSIVTFEPFLSADSDQLSSTYPFVVDAYLTDASGNELNTVVGGQDVQLHVKFNRDMASDVEPMVSYGGSEPYTDYLVYGNWANASEWVGAMTISPLINQGTQYIRVKDAAAADDKWLLTGTDEARFNFQVTNIGAASMTLQGAGAAGYNELTWVQDDFDTLAGYNLYRSTSYDSTADYSEQPFERVNPSIIVPESDGSGSAINVTTNYIDAAVEQGTDYYYYFTAVDTQFNESSPSNVVMCTPLDQDSPVVKHNVVASVAQGSSITIIAEVTDNVSVESVTLHYRMSGDDSWKSSPMRNTTGDSYQAVIGSYETQIGTLEYYIEATDGENVTFCGTADLPNLVAIADPVTVTGVSVSPGSANMQVGDELRLTANVTPEGVTQPGLTWATSDIAVATVADDGTVTAQGPGKATITCTSANGKHGSASITVRKQSETTLAVDTVNAAPGETVEVPVRIDKNCGIAGMELTFSYDSEKLVYEGVEAGSLLNGANLINGDAPEGTASVVWYTGANVTDDGEMLKLLFTVKEGVEFGAVAPIGVSYEEDGVSDADFNYLDINISAGTVKVAEWLIGDVYEDGKVNVRDAILLQQSLTNLADLSLHQMNLADVDGNGSVGMVDLLKLGKQIANSLLTSMAPQMLSLGTQSEGSAEVTVSVGTGQIDQDGRVQVPVSFESSEAGVAAFRFTLRYDDAIFNLADVRMSDVLQGGSLMFNDLGEGEAVITWYSASKEAGAGEAMTLAFQRIGTMPRAISPVSLAASDGDVVAMGGEPRNVVFEDGAIAPPACVADEGHVWDSGAVSKAASCTELGVMKYTCSICGTTRSEEIPMVPHELEAVEAVPSTCTEPGVAAHWRCKECTAEFGDEEGESAVTAQDLATPLSPHAYEGTVTRPTCTESGYTTWVCADCGDTYVDSHVNATGHVPGEVVIENEVEATWDADGSRDGVVYCKDCGLELSRASETIPALNSNPEVVVAKHVADAEAAINAIGLVETDENGDPPATTSAAMSAARTIYDALTAEEKALVSNYATLQTAEKKLTDDKAAAAERAQAAADLQAAKDQALADLAAAQQKAAADIAAAQQKAANDLAAAQSQAAADLKSAQEKAAADVEAAQQKAAADIAAAIEAQKDADEESAKKQIDEVRKTAAEELAAAEAAAAADLAAAQKDADKRVADAETKAAEELAAAQDEADKRLAEAQASADKRLAEALQAADERMAAAVAAQKEADDKLAEQQAQAAAEELKQAKEKAANDIETAKSAAAEEVAAAKKQAAEQVEAAKEQVRAELSEEIGRTNEELERLKAQIEELVEELSKTKDDLSKANEEVAKKSEELEETGNKLAKANDELTATKGKLAAATTELNRAKEPKPLGVGSFITDGKAIYRVTKSGDAPEVALYRAPSAKSVSVPAAVTYNGISYKATSIATRAFAENVKLKKVVVGKNVLSISASAFLNCKNLTSLTIGKSVKKIGKNALKGTPKLKTVKVSSRKLTKVSIKNMLRKSSVKTIKLNGKAAKKMKKKYQTWAGKKVTVS